MLKDSVKKHSLFLQMVVTLVVSAHADASESVCCGSMLSLEAMVADQFTAQRQGTTAFHGLMRLRSSSCTTVLVCHKGNSNSSMEKCQTVEQVVLALLRCIVYLRVPLLISREHIVLAICLVMLLICHGCFHCLRFLGLFCLHRQMT